MDVKPDVNSMIAEMSPAFKAQAEMVKELAASNAQLQKDMMEVLNKTSLQEPTSLPQSTFSKSAVAMNSSSETLLAHFRIPRTRPLPEDRWRGGRDVKAFLKKIQDSGTGPIGCDPRHGVE